MRNTVVSFADLHIKSNLFPTLPSETLSQSCEKLPLATMTLFSNATYLTVFGNHTKSRIQHCERSELLLVYPELRPGELRPDNSGRLIQARPNSGPAIPIQAGPNSGPSHLRPAYPNSGLSQFRPVPFQAGLCHFRPVPFQAGPTQAGANSGRCQLRPSCPISGPFQFRFIPSQAGTISGPSQFRPSCPNSGRCQLRPVPF